MSDIPGRILNWLKSLGGGGVEIPEPSTPDVPASELMQRAAQCYARASWSADAARLYEELGDVRRVAPYYEQQGRLGAAGLCYEHLTDWANAARCFRQEGDFDRAAECLVKAGQVLEGAWVWANLAGQFHRSEHTARQFEARTVFELLAIELILVRCEVGLGAKSAGRRLRRVVVELQGLGADFQVRRLREWALVCADVLGRSDLAVLIHAIGVEVGVPGARDSWQEWSIEVLGDAAAVPRSDRSLAGNED